MSRKHVCCVPNCYNVLGTRGTCFFAVPTTVERRQKWIEFIGPSVRIGQNTKVCSAHFAPGDILGLGRLKKEAIPTIPPSRSVTKHESAQEESSPVNRIGNEESPTHSADDGCTEVVTSQEMDESGVIDRVKQEICRVCGCKDDNLISIFDISSEENTYNVSLVKMLEMYLPLKIQDDDKLPSKICTKCSCMVNQWHELYITCVAADKTFRNMFCQGNFEGDHYEPVGRLLKEVAHFTICDESSMGDYLVLKMKENVNENRNLQRSDNNVSDKSDCLKDKTYRTIKISGEEKIMYPGIQRYQISCRYCGDIFEDRSRWRSHYARCKENLTICEECGKIIPRKNLTQHKFRYHSTKKLCEKCGKRFYPRFLSYHLLTHRSETYYCNLCWKLFKTKTGLQRHIIGHKTSEIKTTCKLKTVMNDDKIVFVCPVCDLNFVDERSVIMHLNQSKRMKCSVCRLKFNNEKLFYGHKCKKWTCQYCTQSFYCKTTLIGHERIHTGETPYKCKFCNLSFKTGSVRNVHQRSAHSKPTLKCTYCPKKFHVPCYLRYHMDIHEGVRYPCPICDKPFTRSESLHKHIKLHKAGRI